MGSNPSGCCGDQVCDCDFTVDELTATFMSMNDPTCPFHGVSLKNGESKSITCNGNSISVTCRIARATSSPLLVSLLGCPDGVVDNWGMDCPNECTPFTTSDQGQLDCPCSELSMCGNLEVTLTK